jgi:hypothetical protein
MCPPGGTDQLGYIRRYPMGAVVRSPAPVTETGATALVETFEPFVAGLATDAVACAEFSHGVQIAPMIGDEAFTLFHG